MENVVRVLGAVAGSGRRSARSYWSIGHLPYLTTCAGIIEPRMDLQPSDIVFLAMVLWLAIELTSGGGGGRRKRVPVAF